MKAFVVRPCVIACAEKANYIFFFWITAQKAALPDWKMICLLKENQSGRVLFWFCAQWISYWCDVCCASAFMRLFQHHLRSLHNIIQTKLFWGNILGAWMSSSDCVKGTKFTAPFTFRLHQFYPCVASHSHVNGGRKRRGKPMCLPLHLPGRHLRVLHHIGTQRWQDVVRRQQELRWRPQMGFLSWPRYEYYLWVFFSCCRSGGWIFPQKTE